jgi:hypothetical protein
MEDMRMKDEDMKDMEVLINRDPKGLSALWRSLRQGLRAFYLSVFP